MVTDSQYKRAIEDSQYRQQFLNDIDLEDANPYVSSLVHLPDEDLGTWGDVFRNRMATHPAILARLHVKGTKSKIKVYSSAFSLERYPKLDDFLGTIIDHEGYHAKEFFENPRDTLKPLWEIAYRNFKANLRNIFNPPNYELEVLELANIRLANPTPLKARREIGPLKNQIKNMGRRDVSQIYKDVVMQNYNFYKKKLESQAKT